MSNDTARREAAARRAAARNGLSLRKSRRRRTDAPDFGRYWLHADNGNFAVLGGEWGASLEEVEEFLFEEDRSPAGYRRRGSDVDFGVAGKPLDDLS